MHTLIMPIIMRTKLFQLGTLYEFHLQRNLHDVEDKDSQAAISQAWLLTVLMIDTIAHC